MSQNAISLRHVSLGKKKPSGLRPGEYELGEPWGYLLGQKGRNMPVMGIYHDEMPMCL